MRKKSQNIRFLSRLVLLAGLVLAIGSCAPTPAASIVIFEASTELKPGDSVPLKAHVTQGDTVRFEWKAKCLQADDHQCQQVLKETEGEKNFITAPDRPGEQIFVSVVAVDSRGKESEQDIKIVKVVAPTSPVPELTAAPTVTLSVAGTTASGQVSGLDPAQYPAYKVLVYLKTDVWYIQPVLGGFASIQADGTWRMPELKIVPGAPTTAYAYLARSDYQAPDKSPLEPQVDGVHIIAGAEPVIVQKRVTPVISVTPAPVTPDAASITLSVARTTASGQVSGLDPAQYPAYQVLVYLKTDVWYIQPILGGFASIQADGTWQISDLKLVLGAPTTAYAYLARRDYQAPDKTPVELQVDDDEIIARAEPVEVQ